MHTSVLLNEVLAAFPHPLNIFVDGTLGMGGHGEAILQAHPEIKKLYGIDRDPEALAMAKERLGEILIPLHGPFSAMEELIQERVDGILLDIGVSSLQLDKAEKGFSFMREGPLDMRMNPENPVDAASIVNRYSEKELGVLFRDYGEERHWRTAAKAIVQARKKKKIETTLDLCRALESTLPRRGKLHPMTRVFQALRIEVNQELEELKAVIPQALELLNPQGRLAVITFHSLEDRIVKHLFRHFHLEEKCVDLLTKKPVVASRDECRKNRRARSAKLRIIEKR